MKLTSYKELDIHNSSAFRCLNDSIQFMAVVAVNIEIIIIGITVYNIEETFIPQGFLLLLLFDGLSMIYQIVSYTAAHFQSYMTKQRRCGGGRSKVLLYSTRCFVCLAASVKKFFRIE